MIPFSAKNSFGRGIAKGIKFLEVIWKGHPLRSANVPELDCVLDTSAIVCALEDEPGADVVGKRLGLARAGRLRSARAV